MKTFIFGTLGFAALLSGLVAPFFFTFSNIDMTFFHFGSVIFGVYFFSLSMLYSR